MNGNWVSYGLGVGGADIVGLVYTGRLIALEVKAEKGKLRLEQKQWLEAIREMGGYACVVRNVEEALLAVERALANEPSPPITTPVVDR